MMKWFVFRNHTIEAFFDEKTTSFSGYDDVSVVPTEAEGYVWFYQVPVKFNSTTLEQEISFFKEKLKLVLDQTGSKPFVIFTLENLVDTKLSTGDMAVNEAIAKFNGKARSLAKKYSHVKVVDFGEFTRRYSADQLINWKFYFLSQSLLNPKLAKDFKAWWHRIEGELTFVRKKCIVLDLDNTIWGGILGEDGPEGLKIGGDYPGNAFQYWQQGLVELCNNGVILTLCSKNNADEAMKFWQTSPDMILRREHISASKVNWQPKDQNIKELAEELNIGLDSMVFLDDNPAERELVRLALPMVAVPEFPAKPYELVDFYQKLVRDYFRIYELTAEDSDKARQYKANAKRKAEQKRFVVFDDYLRSLDIEISVKKASRHNITRITQLTQKTNQFNLTTRRYSEATIRQMIGEGSMVYCLNVADRFGSYGISGVMIATHTGPDTAHIDTLLLSCRVLGKGIEVAFVSHMFNLLAKNGYQSVTASYLPTKKNSQVKDFWAKMGGVIIEQSADGSTSYKIDLNHKFEIKDYYRLR